MLARRRDAKSLEMSLAIRAGRSAIGSKGSPSSVRAAAESLLAV